MARTTRSVPLAVQYVGTANPWHRGRRMAEVPAADAATTQHQRDGLRPGALVSMTGGSGGSGGGTDLTLQIICWDLQIQGNSSFHFYYRNDGFTARPGYGLVR